MLPFEPLLFLVRLCIGLIFVYFFACAGNYLRLRDLGATLVCTWRAQLLFLGPTLIAAEFEAAPWLLAPVSFLQLGRCVAAHGCRTETRPAALDGERCRLRSRVQHPDAPAGKGRKTRCDRGRLREPVHPASGSGKPGGANIGNPGAICCGSNA
jgi:hypothetical protein